MFIEQRLEREYRHSYPRIAAEGLSEIIAGESACFHSEVDREIAQGILVRLTDRVDSDLINQETYRNALEALHTLIPRRNSEGQRVIADIVLTPYREKLIKSRLKAKEVSIMGPEGAWGSLPEEVKQEIVHVSGIDVEMTRECTNACSFCSGSEKGPITEKIRFQDLEELFRYLEKYRLPDSRLALDNLYHSTDPFDAKWIINGEESDYLDVAELYWSTLHLKSALFTSTAMPIGEEFRVMQFALNLLDKYVNDKFDYWSDGNSMRISQTDDNLGRVTAIRSILEALHYYPIIPEEETGTIHGIAITNNRSERPRIMGNRWNTIDVRNIRHRDIYGINCNDTIVIGTREVSGRIMQGASNERLNGEMVIPVKDIRNSRDGETRYSVVHYQYGRYPELCESVYGFDYIYPDAKLTKFVYQEGKMRKSETKRTFDSHRALLRLTSYMDFLLIHGKGKEFSEAEKQLYRTHMQKDVELVFHHIVKRKWSTPSTVNKSMNRTLGYLIATGLIESKIRLLW
jgi:hypothetical protein